MNVLVTGAAGLLGVEVAAGLAESGHAVVGMVHREREPKRNDGRPLQANEGLDAIAGGAVTLLPGDITQPGLGLETSDYDALAGTLDLIVHTAAVVEFGLPEETYRTVNVDGTRHVLELAQARSTPLLFTSTAYVCGESDGVFTEDDFDRGRRFGNEYEASKFQAEALVREAAANGLPTIIARPSIIVGASTNGRVRDFANVYPIIRLLTDGKVRSLPGRYEAVVDLVPIDVVIAGMLGLAGDFERFAGRTYHLVNSRPVTLRDFSDVMAEYPQFHVPRYIPPENFDEGAMTGEERRYYQRVVKLYLPYFRRNVTFANDRALEVIGPRRAMNAKPLLRKMYDYCLKVGYLGRRARREAAEAVAAV
jgi:nucleoside-diphosphate-sugar epimerase